MSADKFTSGPWKVQPRSNNMIDITHSDSGPGRITLALCRVQSRQSWVEESTANARLIAAAPALYEALKSMLAIHTKSAGFNGQYGTKLTEFIEAQSVKVDAAIAKARAALALVGDKP
jgi:hypothetical protein